MRFFLVNNTIDTGKPTVKNKILVFLNEKLITGKTKAFISSLSIRLIKGTLNYETFLFDPSCNLLTVFLGTTSLKHNEKYWLWQWQNNYCLTLQRISIQTQKLWLTSKHKSHNLSQQICYLILPDHRLTNARQLCR